MLFDRLHWRLSVTTKRVFEKLRNDLAKFRQVKNQSPMFCIFRENSFINFDKVIEGAVW